MRFLLALVVILGCGSGDKMSSISESKTLQSLSKDEAKQYCKDMSEYRKKKMSKEANVKLACSGQAIASVMSGDFKDDAAVRAGCKKSLDDCLAKPPADADKDLDCESANVLDEMAKCADLTVGDMNGCAGEMQELLQKAATADPCATLTEKDRMKAITTFMDGLRGPKCDLIDTKCKGDKKNRKGGGDPDGTGKTDPETHDVGMASDTDMAEAMTKMESFEKDMCDCKTKDCALGVQTAMAVWGKEMAKKAKDQKPSKAFAEKATKVMTHFGECMSSALTAETPAAGSAK